MYSYEIQKFLEERNYNIGGEDLKKIISIEENPQLSHIKFNSYNNEYEMWDKEGNYFKFKSNPYKEEYEDYER